MFKPIGYLQVLALALLTACAAGSQHSASGPQASAVQDQAIAAPAPDTQAAGALPASPAVPAPIEPSLAPVVLTPEQLSYAQALAQSRQIPLAVITQHLAQARYNARVAELIAPAKTRIRRSWPTYRQRFVEPIRIRQGQEFWQQHSRLLDRIADQYGVPPAIMVAIVGVETLYGRYTGSFRVLDTLYTLAFHYPQPVRPDRVQLFRDQLADLIELDYRGQLDAGTAQGSFAGAMGLPQFMPGSLKRYARDGDGDQRIDLHHSVADTLASIANFLIAHGWQPGLPVFAPVTLPPDAGKLVAGGLEPTLDWATLQAAGARALPGHPSAWQNHPLGVIDLADEPRQQVSYRTATPNFFAITHYNRSYFYATSVAELAAELHTRQAAGADD